MASKVRVTVDVQCWKEHKCCSCGTLFRYLVQKTKKGTGTSALQAQSRATHAGLRAAKYQAELQPCPTCGLYQPDMVGSWRRRRHGYLALATAAAFVILSPQGEAGNISKDVLLWFGTALGALIVLGHLFVIKRTFNGNLETNLRRASQEMEAGRLRTTGAPPAPQAPGHDVHSQRGAWPIFLVMLFATAAIPVAEVVRRHHGWPWNADWNSPVVGPGDKTTIRFPHAVNSVKGLWNGTVACRVLNASEVGLRDNGLLAETSTAKWEGTLSLRSDAKSVRVTPWARISIPELAELQGKTLRVAVNLKITYPMKKGPQQYVNTQSGFKHVTNLVLATSRAGELYGVLWWSGFLGGGILLGLAGLVLVLRANRLMGSDLAPRICNLDEDGTTPIGFPDSGHLASAVQSSRGEFASQPAVTDTEIEAAGVLKEPKKAAPSLAPNLGTSAQSFIERHQEKQQRGLKRARTWLLVSILILTVGSAVPLALLFLFPADLDLGVLMLTAVGFFTVGMLGTIRFGVDLMWFKREERYHDSPRDDPGTRASPD